MTFVKCFSRLGRRGRSENVAAGPKKNPAGDETFAAPCVRFMATLSPRMDETKFVRSAVKLKTSS